MDGIYIAVGITLLSLILILAAVVMLAVKRMHESVMATNEILNQRLQTKEGVLQLPEGFANQLHDKVNELERMNHQVIESVIQISQAFQAEGRKMNEAIGAIQETLGIYANQVVTSETELKRYKDGYDAYIVKGFSSRLAQTRQLIENEIKHSESDKEKKLFSDVLDAFDDGLIGVGIEEYSPEVGSSAREAFGVSGNYEVEPTDDPEMHGKIARVVRTGLRIVSPSDNPKPIREARVAVFQHNNASEEK